MAKFKLKWSESVIQYWEKEVEAESIEEAENLYHNGEHITGDEEIVETTFLESELEGAEPITAEDVFLCDDCQNVITKKQWKENQGLCDFCIDKIN